MNIYLLTRKPPNDYDQNLGHVIRAPYENAARLLAANAARMEGREPWISEDLEVELLARNVDGAEGILLTSSING
jgi:hypothetical protein